MSQDTLSDVLRAVRLRGAVFFSVSCSGKWAAEAPAAKEIAPLLMPGTEHVIGTTQSRRATAGPALLVSRRCSCLQATG